MQEFNLSTPPKEGQVIMLFLVKRDDTKKDTGTTERFMYVGKYHYSKEKQSSFLNPLNTTEYPTSYLQFRLFENQDLHVTTSYKPKSKTELGKKLIRVNKKTETKIGVMIPIEGSININALPYDTIDETWAPFNQTTLDEIRKFSGGKQTYKSRSKSKRKKRTRRS